ncbi:MAG: ABC transporter ATP-binding protein [Thermoplasmatota archaeon]
MSLAGAATQAATSKRPALELRAVVKEYGQYAEKVQALKGVDLKIYPGEFVAVIGASGSGKSTALHAMGILDRPTSGDVLIDGQSTAKMSRTGAAKFRAKKLGFIFQGYNLIPRLTVMENVTLPGTFAGVAQSTLEERAKVLLGVVGLSHRIDHKAVHLSGGEQQRAAIARALINEPVLILADEPTGALDSTASANVMKLLANLNKERSTTIVFVTHDSTVAANGRRLVRLKDGKIIEDRPQTPTGAAGG